MNYQYLIISVSWLTAGLSVGFAVTVMAQLVHRGRR